MIPNLHRRRAHERRVLAWGLAVAALLHVAAFAYRSGLRAAPLEPDAGMRLVADSAAGAGYGARLDLFFGPPTIFGPDGSATRQPETRFLEAARLVQIFGECPILFDPRQMPVRGRVRLVLDGGGRVESARLVEATEASCAGRLLLRVAEDLLYEWLPSERFPAPVELVQPVMIREARR